MKKQKSPKNLQQELGAKKLGRGIPANQRGKYFHRRSKRSTFEGGKVKGGKVETKLEKKQKKMRRKEFKTGTCRSEVTAGGGGGR